MKLKIFLFLLALCGLLSTARGQRSPIRCPAYSFAFSGCFSPRLVQTQGDSTTVAFVVRNSYVYSLSSRSRLTTPDGRHFPLRHLRVYRRDRDGRLIAPCEAVADEQVELWAEAEGKELRDSVVMVFDALPRQTRTFDFEENYAEPEGLKNSFNVYGIRLDGKAYPARKHPKPAYSTAPLPELHPAWQTARLRVRLEGDLPESVPDVLPSFFFWGGDLLGCHKDYRVQPGRDRRECVVEIDCCEPLTAQVSMLDVSFVPLLVPGAELTASIDMGALVRRREAKQDGPMEECVRFEGEYADLSAVMTFYIDKVSKRQLLMDLVEQVAKTRELPSVAAYRAGMYATLETWRRDIEADTRLTPRQREFLHLYAEDCYVNGVLLYRSNMKQLQQICSVDSMAAEAFDRELSVEDRLPDPHFADLRLFADPQSLRALIVYPTRTDWYDYLRLNRADSGRLFDWAKEKQEALAAMDSIDQLQVRSEAELAALSPNYAPTLRQANERLKETLAEVERAKGKSVCEVPEVKGGQSLLQAIVDLYKGRAVVVDIWDTWCGPCRAAMKAMRPLKEEMKHEEVAFVYICDESSPLSDWTRMLPELGGFHYRLTPEQRRQLQLASGSIPHYFVFNKEGELTFDVLGYSNQLPDAIRKEINKILHP